MSRFCSCEICGGSGDCLGEPCVCVLAGCCDEHVPDLLVGAPVGEVPAVCPPPVAVSCPPCSSAPAPTVAPPVAAVTSAVPQIEIFRLALTMIAVDARLQCYCGPASSGGLCAKCAAALVLNF